MKKKTLRERVLEHLKKYGSITSWDAITRFGATRLSAIIYDLRDKGYNISSDKWVRRKNRFGETVNYVVYEYRGEEDDMKLFINGKEVKELK